MQYHELSLTNIGCNPSKGGLFRSGPILKGDACIGMQNASFKKDWCIYENTALILLHFIVFIMENTALHGNRYKIQLLSYCISPIMIQHQ